jgi:hypothetical protein
MECNFYTTDPGLGDGVGTLFLSVVVFFPFTIWRGG